MSERSRNVALLGGARPEGVLVQLDALVCREAENHAPKPSVAYGKCLDPL